MLKLLRLEESAAKIARQYHFSESTLTRYRDAFLEGGLKALQDGKRDPVEEQNKDLRKQLAQRGQLIGEVTIANRILKKVWTTRTNVGAAGSGHRGVGDVPASGPAQCRAAVLGGTRSAWYFKPKSSSRSRYRRWPCKELPQETITAVLKMAEDNPWYG